MTISTAAYRTAIIEHVANQGYTDILHLSFNNLRRFDRLWREIACFNHVVDKEILGKKKVHTLPKEHRSDVLYFLEKYPHHPHIHSMWRFPSEEAREKFHELFPIEQTRSKVWTSIVSSGTYESSSIENLGRAANYCSKSSHPWIDWQFLRHSSEF